MLITVLDWRLLMKTIAFYLPQFHCIPENDLFWGEGYTEWVAVKNAIPLYEGHKQPKEPYNEYYYNLLNKEVMKWQSQLMKDYLIDGLCFYHYWFGKGKQALNIPAENLLQWRDIQMPYCFCWANQSWLRKWSRIKGMPWVSKNNSFDGTDNIIFKQIYGREDEWRAHFNYLLPFFSDERYIRYEGKPLFVILCLDDVTCLNEMLSYWNKLAVENGLLGIYVVGCDPKYYESYAVDAYIYHEPSHMLRYILPDFSRGIKRYSYKEATRIIRNERFPFDKKFFGSTFCAYDNTPRYGRTSPESFKENLATCLEKCHLLGADICFIDAWNEWAEGMYLEPDKDNEYRWLMAVKEAKETYKRRIEKTDGNNMLMDAEEYRIRYEESKSRCMFEVLDRWIDTKERNGSALAYLRRRNVRKVLAYGYSAIAKHFIWDCSAEGIEVIGIIDKNDEILGIKTIPINQELPKADAIVITAPFYTDAIYREIRKYHKDITVYTIYELIENEL